MHSSVITDNYFVSSALLSSLRNSLVYTSKCSSRDWNVGGIEAALNQFFSFVISVLRWNWLYEHTTWNMGSFSNHLHCEDLRNT